MNSYDLFVLDDGGRVVERLPFRTGEDESACAMAKHIAAERRFELWHSKRRVHCSHEGPSVLDSYFEVGGSTVFAPAPVWYAACAVRSQAV